MLREPLSCLVHPIRHDPPNNGQGGKTEAERPSNEHAEPDEPDHDVGENRLKLNEDACYRSRQPVGRGEDPRDFANSRRDGARDGAPTRLENIPAPLPKGPPTALLIVFGDSRGYL